MNIILDNNTVCTTSLEQDDVLIVRLSEIYFIEYTFLKFS